MVLVTTTVNIFIQINTIIKRFDYFTTYMYTKIVRKLRQIMSLKETLTQLNIGNKESAIYLATMELGISNASSIAKKAGIQRTHFYDLSEKLLKAGLLQKISKGNKMFFVAAEPDTLVKLQEEKLERLKQVLPEIKALYNTTGQKPKVFFYEGKTGIEQINEDTLLYKGEVLAFTTPRFMTARGTSTGDRYIQKRVMLGNKARVIGENAPEVQALQKRDRDELRETRILSPGVFHSNVELGIYGNRVFIIDYKEESGFIIEGSEVASTLRMIFEIVWDKWK